MTLAELEKRIAALELQVRELREGAEKPNKADPKWVLAHAGRFANDPGFEEVARLGRAYRDSLKPGRKKKAKAANKARAVKHGRA